MAGGLLSLVPLVLMSLTNVEDKSVNCGTSTCGVGAQCTDGSAGPVCACPPGYSGEPLTQCVTIKCDINSECRMDQACINQHCDDPCVGACGVNANCEVRQHASLCSCIPGYTGNPMSECTIIAPSDED